MVELVRLQKYLASLGYGSRRKCEEFISAGIVKVNGEIAELGTKVNPNIDKVEIEEQVVKDERSTYVYIMLNKPRGYITSLKQSDSNSPLVTDLINGFGRVYPVGRLDKDSSGLLLLTNDGDFAFKLTHPSFNKEKEYIVTTKDLFPNSGVEKFKKGINIDGRKTFPASCRKTGSNSFSITLKEGRNRQIRKMVQKIGNSVDTLHRVRVKNLKLGDLKSGSFRELTKKEVDDLISQS